MDWAFLGQLGIVLCFGMAAMGSALGIWAAGQSAAGAWARDATAGKLIRFSYIIFVGAPISQTFYSMIVMNKMSRLFQASAGNASQLAGLLLGIGIATGLGEMMSAWGQGVVGAAACRALSDSDGKGLAVLIIAIGIVETVGILTMVFMLGMVPSV